MTREITHWGKTVKAGEDTPLTLAGLSQFFGMSRPVIYKDIKRGYAMEFGTRTTPAHYRAWLIKNPRPSRGQKAQEAASKLAHELSQLN